MIRMIGARFLAAIPVLLVMTALTFLLVSLIPGGAAIVILGQDATPELIAEFNAALGVDRPLWERYLSWAASAIHGDLGQSLYSGESVIKIIGQRFWPTFWIALLATVLSSVLGIGFGVYAALKGGIISRVLDGLGMLGISLPNFWIALLLIVVFAGQLGVLPAIGYTAPQDDFGEWTRHLVLPVCALGLAGIALIAKQARDAYAEALSRDFMRFLQANGIPRRDLLVTHALRYTAVPLVAAVSVTFVNFFASTAALEQVFAIPGLGSAVVRSTLNHDLVLLQGIVLVYTVVIVMVTLVTDVVYVFLSPKEAGR